MKTDDGNTVRLFVVENSLNEHASTYTAGDYTANF